MNPTLKKVLAAVAIKRGYDLIQENRRPKRRSFLARFAPVGLVVAGSGAAAYLVMTGRLSPLLDRARAATGGSANESYASNTQEMPPQP